MLPTNHKRSAQPGDSKAMLSARRRVLDSGLYQPLAEQLAASLGELDAIETALDLGCGEGYYTQALSQALPMASVAGIDISKEAVRMASKRYTQIEFAVASAFAAPLADTSRQLLLSIFAPLAEQELLRLLPTGGYYLKVTPGARHLWALRKHLYEQPQPHEVASPPPGNLQSVNRWELEYTVPVAGTLLQDLIAMTPYAHTARRSALECIETLQVEMAFQLDLFRRQ